MNHNDTGFKLELGRTETVKRHKEQQCIMTKLSTQQEDVTKVSVYVSKCKGVWLFKSLVNGLRGSCSLQSIIVGGFHFSLSSTTKMGVGKDFLENVPEVQAIRSKNNQIKHRSFHIVKETINKVKRQPTKWEKMLENNAN